MLRRFLYLNTTAVRQYASMVDGGLTETSVATRESNRTTGGGADIKVLNASQERARRDEDSRTVVDTDEARFDRVVRAGEADPEGLGWISVLNPDTDLEGVGIGALVSWECDVWVPQISQLLSKGGELSSALNLMAGFRPFAETLGLQTDGLPAQEQLDAVGQFATAVGAKVAIVGEGDETEWKVTGALEGELVDGDLDGRVVIVGKVRKVVHEGRWQPLLTLPGMNIGSREDRRKRERQQPEQGQEDNYVAGPALVLDVLAIYV